MWAESAYKVTIPQQVHDAYEYNAGRFRTKAQKFWNQSSQEQNIELAKQAIYLWGALEMEDEIFLNIQNSKLLISELYTIAVKVVTQGIRANRISVDAKCCENIEKWFDLNNGSDRNINLMRSKWKLLINEKSLVAKKTIKDFSG